VVEWLAKQGGTEQTGTEHGGPGRWLFPCSRDAPPDLVEQAARLGIRIDRVAIYEPAPIPGAVRHLIESTQLDRDDTATAGAPPSWIVFHSPSAVSAFVDGLNELPLSLRCRGALPMKIAIVGESTAVRWRELSPSSPLIAECPVATFDPRTFARAFIDLVASREVARFHPSAPPELQPPDRTRR
jgi:uroporphyrinogen-III synthase